MRFLLYHNPRFLAITFDKLKEIVYDTVMNTSFSKRRKIIIDALFVIAIGLITSVPLFCDFLYVGHDAQFHYSRLEGIYRGLSYGAFPVRINPNQLDFFGYASGLLYPQLFLYPFALLRFLHVSLINCYKCMIAAINILTAGIMLYSARRLVGSGSVAEYVAAFLYTLNLYRLTDVYTRSSVGEAWALAFMPLVVTGMHEVLWGEHRHWPVLLIGLWGVAESHVLTLGLCLIYCVAETAVWLVSKRHNQIHRRIMALSLTAVLTALLNLPFIVSYLTFCNTDLRIFNLTAQGIGDHAVHPYEIFRMFPKATGSSLPGGSVQSRMPLTVGIILPIFGILFICGIIRRRRHLTESDRTGVRLFIYSAVLLFMSSCIFPWDGFTNVPILGKLATTLQFPFRLLGPAALCLSLVAGIAVERLILCQSLPTLLRAFVPAAVGILTLCSAAYFFYSYRSTATVSAEEAEQLARYADKIYLYCDEGVPTEDRFYGDFATTTDGYDDIAIKYYTDATKAEIYATGSDIDVTLLSRKGTEISAWVTPVTYTPDARLVLPLYYYPGYEITVDGEPVPVISTSRRVSCNLPACAAQVDVRYVGLLSERIAEWIAAITALLLSVAGAVNHLRQPKDTDSVSQRPRG